MKRIPDAAPMRGVDGAEWLKTLLRVQDGDGDGLTTKEWAAALGVSEVRALALLKKADAQGRVRHAVKRIAKFGGGSQMAPCYVVVPETKGGRK